MAVTSHCLKKFCMLMCNPECIPVHERTPAKLLSWLQLDLSRLIGQLVIMHGLLDELWQLCNACGPAVDMPVEVTQAMQLLVLNLMKQQLKLWQGLINFRMTDFESAACMVLVLQPARTCASAARFCSAKASQR